MDVSNLKSTARAPSVSGTGKPAAAGNSLPVSGQGSVRSEKAEAAPAPGQNAAKQPTAAELRELVGQANSALQARFSDLKFTVDESTDINIVRIEDTNTGELIRQIPSKALIAFARTLDEAQQGMVFEEKA